MSINTASTPTEREPFFAGVRAISSNYDRREVLTRLAKAGTCRPRVQEAVFGAVVDMTSDYDRAEVLVAFVPAVDADQPPCIRLGGGEHQVARTIRIASSRRW